MIIRVTMKDPDTLSDACFDAARNSVKALEISSNEKKILEESRQEEYYNQASEWFEYGEYLTIEIDTELNTCIVIKP